MRCMRKVFCFLCLIALILGWQQVEGFDVNGSVSGQKPSVDASSENSSNDNLGVWISSFFRDHISAVDSDRCPSFPSCSAYSAKAFKKHGFFIGWMMTVDRLIHEWDEETISSLVYDNGRVKIYDPVENNDFWWFRPDQKSEK